MTENQAFGIAMSIMNNESKSTYELTDSIIAFYLEGFGYEATEENIKLVRSV